MSTEVLNGIITVLEIAAIVVLAVLLILRHQRHKKQQEQRDAEREKRRDDELVRLLGNDLAGSGRRPTLVGPASNRLHITIQGPSGVREEYYPCGADIHIGRDPGNDLVLESRYAGRKQCVLLWERGCFFLQNVNATNPTVLVRDGKSGTLGAQKVQLENHDQLQAGDVRLDIELPS